MTATQADIARTVGVSRVTVNRILNGHTTGYAEATVSAVRAAADVGGWEAPGRRRATMERIAADVGVSRVTVGRVLRGPVGGYARITVSDDVAERVRAAAAAVGYDAPYVPRTAWR